MPEAAAIFVSHVSEDNAWCRMFVEVLRQAGASVWDDERHRQDGEVGDTIQRELRARYVSAWNYRGLVLRRQKRYEEALAAFEQALALPPAYKVAWNNKIATLKRLRRKDEEREATRQRDEALRTGS